MLSRSRAELAESREGCFAMVDLLKLEPEWKLISSGQRVDFLAETIIWDPLQSRTLVRTAIHRRFVVIEGPLRQASAFSILNGVLTDATLGLRIRVDANSRVLHHSGCTLPDMWNVSEICSGIGAMSDGIITAGGCIQNKNELRAPLIDFQKRQGFYKLAEGNIGTTEVLAEFFDLHPQSTMMVAGFNCQPWSKLGDQRQLDDPRSMSLVYALRTAFYSRSHGLMLECVSEAGTDPHVLDLLNTWCKLTGYRMCTTNLKLEDFWTSRRNRWWCLLLNPSAPMIDLLPLPKQVVPPTVADLFPNMPLWPGDEETQLSLDLYETNKFIEFGSFEGAVIKSNQPLPTALHGWGNQLQGCPCGCRKGSMDHSRLRHKGLFGALVIMDGQLECVDGPRLRSRHIHPWELSVLTGCPPNKKWMPHLRLALCGLGQMASPIQSCWIYSQYKFAMGKHFDLPDLTSPEEALWAHVKMVFQDYSDKFPSLYKDPRVNTFVSQTHDLLFDAHMNRVVPSPFPSSNVEPILLEQIVVPSQSEPIVTDTETTEQCGKYSADPKFSSLHSTDLDMQGASVTEDGYEWEPQEIAQLGPHDVSHDVHNDQCFQKVQEDIKPFDSAGGIMAFSKQPRSDENFTTSSKRQRVDTVRSSPVPIEPKQTDPAAVIPFSHFEEQPHPEVLQGNQGELIPQGVASVRVVQIFINEAVQPTLVKVPLDCKICDIIAAEVKLGSIATPVHIKDAVGGPLPIQKSVDSFEHIHLHHTGHYLPTSLDSLKASSHESQTRIAILHQQQGWVAQDELDFYLGFLTQLDGVGFLPSLVVPAMDFQICTWIQSLISLAQQNSCSASAILVDHHWHPIVIRHKEGQIWISTTAQMQDLILSLDAEGVGSFRFYLLELPSIFHADCGFQTFGAVLQEVLDHVPQDNFEPPFVSFPVDSHTAVVWRMLFVNHLYSSGQAGQQVVPDTLHFGGGLMDSPEHAISELLRDHGVPSSEVAQRTRIVFEKLSRSRILQAIRSHRPWAELKALCNNQTPKVQLVLPSELAHFIQTRVDKPEHFGDKAKKKSKGTDTPLPIVLAPHDVSIPDGIFKQGQDKLLKQIPVQAIGPEASGVVVVTPHDAAPYLKLTKPISSQGLGLLVLDHSHASCAGSGSLIRFPCKCELTGEPVLASARLIQIGSIEVTKHVPPTAGTVDEVSTHVFRVALYKDETGDDWSQIIQHPIKHIFGVLGIENKGTNPSVVDVWDRQFLTLQMTRTKANQCELFFASIRLVGASSVDLQAKSGFAGVYVEPRSIDGRQPCEQHRVIWLKLDKASTTAAMQSSNLPVHLARHGNRFGLRAAVGIAEEVHRLHKAAVPYLDTANVQKFVVGPFPFGATREGLTKVFDQWGWSARPTQPKGRAPDGVGIQWEVHASTNPPCEVYSMTHGDVIIAALPTKKQVPRAGGDLLASAKTIAFLRSPKDTGAGSSDARDPMQINDPWASYVPSKFARTPIATNNEATMVRVAQVETLAASVDKKLADHMAQIDQRLSNADVQMGPPPGMDQQSTLDDFENRIQAIEQNLHQQQAQQVQHQHQVANQFQKMQTKMDQQTQSFHSHLDQRMTEQLSQIEMLLSKKARTE